MLDHPYINQMRMWLQHGLFRDNVVLEETMFEIEVEDGTMVRTPALQLKPKVQPRRVKQDDDFYEIYLFVDPDTGKVEWFNCGVGSSLDTSVPVTHHKEFIESILPGGELEQWRFDPDYGWQLREV